jgi:hypothetical protein
MVNAETAEAASRAVKNLEMAMVGTSKQTVHNLVEEHHDKPQEAL